MCVRVNTSPLCPFLLFLICFSLFLPTGYESRQPSHDLAGIHPYNPLEDPFSLYPHSLRNTGEPAAQWANMNKKGFSLVLTTIYFLFPDELCASIVRSHRETSQYRVEELLALRWKLLSREEIQAYQSKVYKPDDSLRGGFKIPSHIWENKTRYLK